MLNIPTGEKKEDNKFTICFILYYFQFHIITQSFKNCSFLIFTVGNVKKQNKKKLVIS